MPAVRADFALSPSAGRNNCQSWVFPPKGSVAVCFARWLPWRQVEVTRGKSQSYREDGVRKKSYQTKENLEHLMMEHTRGWPICCLIAHDTFGSFMKGHLPYRWKRVFA